MKSEALALFKYYGENYMSPEISLEEITKMCEACHAESFRIQVRKNEFKTEEDKKPHYVFWVVVDLK